MNASWKPRSSSLFLAFFDKHCSNHIDIRLVIFNNFAIWFTNTTTKDQYHPVSSTGTLSFLALFPCIYFSTVKSISNSANCMFNFLQTMTAFSGHFQSQYFFFEAFLLHHLPCFRLKSSGLLLKRYWKLQPFKWSQMSEIFMIRDVFNVRVMVFNINKGVYIFLVSPPQNFNQNETHLWFSFNV